LAPFCSLELLPNLQTAQTINHQFGIWPAPPAPTSLLLRFISGFEWLSSYATGSVKEMMNAFGGVMRRTALALDDVS
jgi:hypothetical protein